MKLYTSDNHQRNFLDCIRTGEATVTPVEIGHHSAIPGHLCPISMQTRRKIHWDVKEEKIVGDRAASKLLTREYPDPWKMSRAILRLRPGFVCTAGSQWRLFQEPCNSTLASIEET